MNVSEARAETNRLLDKHGLVEKGWTLEFMKHQALSGMPGRIERGFDFHFMRRSGRDYLTTSGIEVFCL